MFSNDTMVALGKAFAPFLLFDPSERFFPVAAEEVLDHESTEPWPDATTHERGTAVLNVARAATVFSDADVVAGAHTPAGHRLTLDANPPNGIGQPFGFDPSVRDVFLDVGGWEDAPDPGDPLAPRFTQGSAAYDDLLFRTLSHQLNPALPIDSPARTPSFTLPRSNQPTVYVECEWAGMYPRQDHDRVTRTGDHPDFPPAIGTSQHSADTVLTDLDTNIALTYYMLYPAMEPSPLVNNDDSRRREGQWEAITVYLRGRPSDHRDEQGRPEFSLEVVEVPPSEAGPGHTEVVGAEARFIAYSRGYDHGADSDSPLKAEVRPLFNVGNSDLAVSTFSNHALAYVTGGTHKNLFSTAAIIHTGDSQPNTTLNPLGGALMGAAGTAAGVCLGLAPPPLTPACIVCLIIAAVVFLIGLILFLLSLFLRDDPPVDEAPDPAGADVARDGGAAALPPGQAQPHRPGVPPSGNGAGMILRFINRFGFDPTPPVAAYPLPRPDVAELPSWWGFVGRWGVRTQNRPATSWDSGTRRTDAFGRSRGYWNTYRLIEFLNAPGRVTDGITA